MPKNGKLGHGMFSKTNPEVDMFPPETEPMSARCQAGIPHAGHPGHRAVAVTRDFPAEFGPELISNNWNRRRPIISRDRSYTRDADNELAPAKIKTLESRRRERNWRTELYEQATIALGPNDCRANEHQQRDCQSEVEQAATRTRHEVILSRAVLASLREMLIATDGNRWTQIKAGGGYYDFPRLPFSLSPRLPLLSVPIGLHLWQQLRALNVMFQAPGQA